MKLIKFAKRLPAKYDSYTEGICYETGNRALFRLMKTGEWEIVFTEEFGGYKFRCYSNQTKPAFVELKDYKPGIVTFNRYNHKVSDLLNLGYYIRDAEIKNTKSINNQLGKYLVHRDGIDKLLELYPYLVNQYQQPFSVKDFNLPWKIIIVKKLQLDITSNQININPIDINSRLTDIPLGHKQMDTIFHVNSEYIFPFWVLQPSYAESYSEEFHDVWERNGYVTDTTVMDILYKKLNHPLAKNKLFDLIYGEKNWSFKKDTQPNYVDYEGLTSYTVTKKGIFTFPKGITAEDVYEQDYEKYAELNNLILIK